MSEIITVDLAKGETPFDKLGSGLQSTFAVIHNGDIARVVRWDGSMAHPHFEIAMCVKDAVAMADLARREQERQVKAMEVRP
jgi:hypothetical protein